MSCTSSLSVWVSTDPYMAITTVRYPLILEDSVNFSHGFCLFLGFVAGMQSLAGISVSFIFKRLLLWSDGSLAILGISSGILGVLLLGVAGFTAVKSTVITDQSQLLSHSPTNHNSSLTDQSQPLSCSPPNHVSPHSHQPIITLLTLINPLWLLYHSQTNRSSAKFCSLTNRDLSHLFSGVLCALVAESDCRSVPACRYN